MTTSRDRPRSVEQERAVEREQTEPTTEASSSVAWWEWPFVVLLSPFVLLGRMARRAGQALWRALAWVGRLLVIPVRRLAALLAGLRALLGRALVWLRSVLATVFRPLVRVLAQAARALRRVVVATVRLFARPLRALWTQLSRIARWIAVGTAWLARWTRPVLSWIGRLLGSALRWVWGGVRAVGRWMAVALRWGWGGLRTVGRWIAVALRWLGRGLLALGRGLRGPLRAVARPFRALGALFVPAIRRVTGAGARAGSRVWARCRALTARTRRLHSLLQRRHTPSPPASGPTEDRPPPAHAPRLDPATSRAGRSAEPAGEATETRREEQRLDSRVG